MKKFDKYFYLEESYLRNNKCYIYYSKDNSGFCDGHITQDIYLSSMNQTTIYKIKYFNSRREALQALTSILGRKLKYGEFKDWTNGRFG